ncbi:FlhC family transcriptional regulator [Salmonella enterica]
MQLIAEQGKTANNKRKVYPFTNEWFLDKQNRLHARYFCTIWQLLREKNELNDIKRVIDAYYLYIDDCLPEFNTGPLLTLVQGWALVQTCKQCLLYSGECQSIDRSCPLFFE